jgi:hypothetical protein
MCPSASRTFARACALLLLAGGCTLMSARDELGEVMRQEIGKTLDDSGSYRASHPKLRIGARKLSNGNVEEEYRAGFRDQCPVFFEVDPATGRALGWHFGTPDDDCILGKPLFEKKS